MTHRAMCREQVASRKPGRMDIPDVFSEIAVRLDDETLAKLVTPAFLPTLRLVLSNQDFWRRRCSFVVSVELSSRPDVDWRRVYRTLLETERQRLEQLEQGPDLSHPYYTAQQSGMPQQVIWRHLDYAPALPVLEEVYGKPQWDETEESKVAGEIETTEVLTNIIAAHYIAPSTENILSCLYTACVHGREALILLTLSILDVIKDEIGFTDDEEEAIREQIEVCAAAAARAGQLASLEHLPDFALTGGQLSLAAIEGGNESVLRFVLTQTKLDGRELIDAAMKSESRLFQIVLEHFHLPDVALAELFLGNIVLANGDEAINKLAVYHKIESLDIRERMLSRVVNARNLSLLSSILKLDKEVQITPDMMRAAFVGGSELLSIVLADPRGLDTENIEALLGKARVTRKASKIARLVLDRVPVQDLSPRSVQVLFQILDLIIAERVRGASVARDIAEVDTRTPGVDVKTEAMRDSLYAHTLRFILLKRPTAAELADWMIELDDPELQQAASSALTRVKIGPMWTRALMSCMLYPTLRLTRLFSELREESMRRASESRELERAAAVIGVYLGMQGVRDRI